MLRSFLAAMAFVAASAASAAPAAATETVTVPGCFGVAVIVCDLTVEVGLPVGVETYETVVPVCAGTCTDVPVTLVRPTSGDPAGLCVSYEDRGGSEAFRACVPGGLTLPDYEVGRCGFKNQGVYVYDRQSGTYLIEACDSTNISVIELVCDAWDLLPPAIVAEPSAC